MKRNNPKRTENAQRASAAENAIADSEHYDEVVGKISADCYERIWKSRIKVRQLDVWIAVGLYLVLSGIAFIYI